MIYGHLVVKCKAIATSFQCRITCNASTVYGLSDIIRYYAI